MSSRTFVVAERQDVVQLGMPDPMYRAIVLRGATYDERSLREWANDRWGVAKEAPLDSHFAAMAKGGWSALEIVS